MNTLETILSFLGCGLIGAVSFFISLARARKKEIEEKEKKLKEEIEEKTKLKLGVDALHNRVDQIEKSEKDREDSCPMKEKIKEHGAKIKDLEDENKNTAVQVGKFETRLEAIESTVEEVRQDTKKILTAVSK